MEVVLDFDTCLARLAVLAAHDDPAALDGVDGVIDAYLAALGPDRGAQAQALFRVIAAFIVQDRATRQRDAMTQHLTRRHADLLSDMPAALRPVQADPADRLMARLTTLRGRGLHLSPAEVELVLGLIGARTGS